MYVYSRSLDKIVDDMYFHQLKGMDSRISCYPNPSMEALPLLKELYGINMLITSINHVSQIYYTKTKCKELDITYFNILMQNHKEAEPNIKMIVQQIKDIFDILQKNTFSLIINPSSGVFASTVIAYCLLRMSGENRVDALNILTKLKFESKIRLGELRYEFCERKLIPYLIPKELIKV